MFACPAAEVLERRALGGLSYLSAEPVAQPGAEAQAEGLMVAEQEALRRRVCSCASLPAEGHRGSAQWSIVRLSFVLIAVGPCGC